MKTIQEEIKLNNESSFRLMVNPKLNDFYFWHFHPEYELVFIDNASGTRHVGNHISKFIGSDLVLIGSSIPHLNFDYGVKTAYRKMVVHINPKFIASNNQHLPEMQTIIQLFERAKHGIAFGEETKQKLRENVFSLNQQSTFNLFLKLLEIFNELGNAADSVLLHEKAFINQFAEREHERISTIYKFVDDNYFRKITLDEVAYLSNLTNEAFCRYFKKMTKLTFIEFLNHFRVNQAKRLILEGKTIADAAFESGFESISYFNRTFKKITEQNPNQFKKAHYNI